MCVIKRIQMENFQSHKDTDIDLHPGVNMIVGESDQGKTNVLRAIKWVVMNKPAGESFKSTWAKEGCTSVALNTPEGSVRRVRSKMDNLYTTNSRYEFRAFGQGTPEEVDKILNFADVNFQNQMDAPFLISETSGEVARYLNRVVDLEVIDSTQANINRRVRGFKSAVENDDLELDAVLNELANMDWVDDLQEDVDEIDQLLGEQMDLVREGCAITNILKEYNELQENSDFKILENEPLLKEVEELQLERMGVRESFSDLRVLLEEHEQAQELYNAADLQLIKLKKKWADGFPKTCPLCGK